MLQLEHSALLLTCIKLPFVIKMFVLSIIEWPFYTGFTVCGFYTKNIKLQSRLDVALFFTGYYFDQASGKRASI